MNQGAAADCGKHRESIMMDNNFKVNMNEYLPLRDVVFNTLRQAILKGELAPERGLWRSSWLRSWG